MFSTLPLPHCVTLLRLSKGTDIGQVDDIVLGCILPLMTGNIIGGPRLHTDGDGYVTATFRVTWWMDACAIKLALHNRIRFRNLGADLAKISIF